LKKDFKKNNVNAFVLVKIKQFCSKQSLILKNNSSGFSRAQPRLNVDG
jgi:hypothetical protein